MSLQQIHSTYYEWQDDLLTDGEALDYLLDIALVDVDPNLTIYVLNTDGDELTDSEAIELIYFRYLQLKG